MSTQDTLDGANRYLRIACSNKPSDNKMSYKKGISELIFQIPEMSTFLIPSTIRLVGNIRCYKNIKNPPDQADGNIGINQRLGVYGIMNAVTCRSLVHQTTIEQTRHFNRFLASYLPLTASNQDMAGHLSNTTLSTLDYADENANVVHFNGPVPFCCHIPTGFLSNPEVPLARQWGIGGLELSITLESDAQFFYATDGTVTQPDTWYELDDPHLVCEVRQPSVDELSQLTRRTGGQLTYQSVSAFYDTINSTNAQINFTLGLSKVKSVFANFIRSSYLSNLGQDGLVTASPVLDTNLLTNVLRVIWLKGGTQYPLHYPINTNVRTEADALATDPQLVRDYINAVVPFSSNRATQANVETTNRNYVLNAAGNQKPYTQVIDGGLVWGLGVTYDDLGGNGADFTQQTWGLNIELRENDDCPNSVFIFANSEQTLVFNENGVQVLK